MNLEPRVDVLATALADRARATIVCAAMDGRAYTAKELAYRAGVSPQTASFHLKTLLAHGILACRPQGRHRYYRLTGEAVATALEGLMTLAPRDHLRALPPRAAAEVMTARSCYNHIAGRLGVLIAERLAERGALLSRGGGFALTPVGLALCQSLGLAGETLQRGRQPLVRHCLDWTERRDHYAGALATALFQRGLERAWWRRQPDSRALAVTHKGFEVLKATLGLERREILGEGAETLPRAAEA